MKLPFTIQQFFEVFRKYNTTFYPLQILFVLLAAFVILLLFNKKNSGRTIMFIVAGFWLWIGVVYHIIFFSAINKAAYGFGGLFILEAILLLIYGLISNPSFSFKRNLYGILSALLLVYALIIYPVIGYLAGHSYPYSPTFGLPCPTTIFTFAVFLLSDKRLPSYIIVLPFIWSLIGFSASFMLGIYEDIALIISGLILTIMNFFKPGRLKTTQKLS